MTSIPHHNGFALLEAMISFLLICISVAAFVALGNALTRSGSRVKQNIQAINFAKSKIEYFSSYQTLNTTAGKLAYQDIANGSDVPTTFTGDNTVYTRSWTVTSFNAPTYKIVDVVVSWVDSIGTNRSVELVSIISQFDPANTVT